MTETRCNLCGSTYYKVVYHVEEAGASSSVPGYKITADRDSLSSLRIVRCLICGLVYANPQGERDNISLQYRNFQDEAYVSEEQGRRLCAKIVLKKLARYKRKGRILDIGCATGFLLDEARKQGWEVFGVESSQWAVTFARQRFNLNIAEGQLHEAKFPHNYFDVVILMDSLEHLVNPKSALGQIRRILKPNGILYISTPDIDSFFSKLLKMKWWGIQQLHLYYFSRKTLGKLLEAAGFKVIKYAAYERAFHIAYLHTRIKDYNKFLSGLFSSITKYKFLRNRLLKVSLNDQIEVFAQKKRSLTYIFDDERVDKDEAVQKKTKTIVVLPAYNAAKTLELTVKDIPKDLVDEIILVDDASSDNTVEVAKRLGLTVFTHLQNKGYGANQKTCYAKALERGADIVVMVHPDYQYDPTVISTLIEPIQNGRADAVFGSRMMKGGALEGGMPLWKHNANILLTALENVILGTYLTEYHSGFRAYSARYLKTVNFLANSDGFIFDNEIIIQGILYYFKIEEVPIKTRYFEEASTIRFIPAIIYGLGILITILKYIFHTKGIIHFRQFA